MKLSEMKQILAQGNIQLTKSLGQNFLHDANQLGRIVAAAENLTLVHDDALDYVRRQPEAWSDWKLVANLPYSVASRLLVELASAATGPKLMVATLQVEVARRLVASPRDEDYGVLTLLVQFQYEPEGMFKIPPSCFFPEPDVDSACVKLVPRSQPLLAPEQ